MVLEAAENGLLLSASPYVENEMHWHQGDGVFFAMDGSSISFERDTNGGITNLVTNKVIRGAKKRR
jgi:hypothetical protein